MENVVELTKLVSRLEKNHAIAFLDKISSDTSCQKYAQAREKILLAEAAKELNKQLPSFYVDAKGFAESLFSENPPPRQEAIDILCQEVKAAGRESKERTLKKALSYIAENICDNQLAIGNVAEYAGISPSLLTKLFAENMGTTPVDYLGKLRVEKSLEFLKADLTVEQAAKKSGYTSTETYIRVFKKVMGITPGAWKRNNLFL